MTFKSINWQPWISVLGPVAVAILYLWINSYFTTDAEFNKYKESMDTEMKEIKTNITNIKTELETDNVQILNLENKINDIGDRQEKKVKQLNDLLRDVDDIENWYIELKTEVKYLSK